MNTFADSIEQACQVLRRGGVILYPTDTVWGLGCDATVAAAVEKVARIKKRADHKSFIVLVADTRSLEQHVAQIPDIAYDLLDVTQTPLTIIYPQGCDLATGVLGPDGSVGIRIPHHDFCSALCRAFRKPLLSTSANISGEPAPAFFDEIAPVIRQAVDWTAPVEAEEGATGQPSSIIQLGLKGEIKILRP